MQPLSIRITQRAELGDKSHETFIEIDNLPPAPRVECIAAPTPAVLTTTTHSHRRLRIAVDGTQIAHDDSATPHVAVLDEATGLLWSITSLGDSDGDPVTHSTAVDLAAGLDLLGYRDWRLPTRAELVGLVDDTRHEPAIDTALFPNVKPRWHWTSTPTAWSASAAWVVDFNDGSVVDDHRDDGYGFALAVRRAGQ